MASLEDILSVAKSLTQAVNALTTTILQINGFQSSLGIASNTLVHTGTGRIVCLSVLVAGSTEGSVHDVALVANATTANQIAVIPMTVGMTVVNMSYQYGLVVKTGTSQTVSVGFA